MNPLEKLILEHQKRGGTVVSVFADATEAGIRVRNKDFTTTYRVVSSDLDLNEKWIADAIRLLPLNPQ